MYCSDWGNDSQSASPYQTAEHGHNHQYSQPECLRRVTFSNLFGGGAGKAHIKKYMNNNSDLPSHYIDVTVAVHMSVSYTFLGGYTLKTSHMNQITELYRFDYCYLLQCRLVLTT